MRGNIFTVLHCFYYRSIAIEKRISPVARANGAFPRGVAIYSGRNFSGAPRTSFSRLASSLRVFRLFLGFPLPSIRNTSVNESLDIKNGIWEIGSPCPASPVRARRAGLVRFAGGLQGRDYRHHGVGEESPHEIAMGFERSVRSGSMNVS